MIEQTTIHIGDVLTGLGKIADGSVQCCVTSPPYWGLRAYLPTGHPDKHLEIGSEPTPELFVARMVEVFREVRRCLRDDGVLFLNLGDSYSGGGNNKPHTGGAGVAGSQGQCLTTKPMGDMKPKDLCMIPWRVALALQADGWWLRSIICWAKKAPMPESVTDQPTSSWEPIFLLAKSDRYFYDAHAVREPQSAGTFERFGNGNAARKTTTKAYASNEGEVRSNAGFKNSTPDAILSGGRNQRNVWHLSPENFADAHFATFPTEIPRRAILAGTSERGQCPECGAGWVRETERQTRTGSYHDHSADLSEGMSQPQPAKMMGSNFYNNYKPPKTTGWRAQCSCNAGEPVPQLVLDPFLGSGTTLAVAAQLGRRGVGCELNPEYAAMARDRIGRTAKPATYQSERVRDAPLFGVGA